MAARYRLLLALCVAALGALATALPVSAAEPKMPGGPPEKPYHRWEYPSQIPGGPLEEAISAPRPAAGGAFLTLPFVGPHYVTSIFDHCSPNYVPDGLVCRYDGLTKLAGGFDETGPPSQAWLFYDGHDGLDYGLYYENVVAAADGRVVYADWNRPGCATCGYWQEVRIYHGNGITTRYAHLSKILAGGGGRLHLHRRARPLLLVPGHRPQRPRLDGNCQLGRGRGWSRPQLLGWSASTYFDKVAVTLSVTDE